MSPPTPQPESTEPPKVAAGGTYTIDDVGVGFKIFVRRPVPGGGEEQRKAEVLSIREKKKPLYQAPIPRAGASSTEAPEDKMEYYIHWVEFNKRLDEWVIGSRLVLSRELEWPKPKPPPAAATTKKEATPKAPSKVPKKSGPGMLKKATMGAAAAAGLAKGKGTGVMSGTTTPSRSPSLGPPGTPSTPGTPTPSGRGIKRKGPPSEYDNEMEDAEGEEDYAESDRDAEGDSYIDPDADGDMDMDVDADGEAEPDGDLDMGEDSQGVGGESQVLGVADADGVTTQADPRKPTQVFSKKQEIEKLRHGGSMTQAVHEIARVKNLNRIQMGQHEVEAWYFSPYPVEYAHLPVIYVCEFCLGYYPSPKMFERHRKKCQMKSPPGNEIYREDDISFFEIDGKKQLTWCRNLSLLSKCFLDHKTLYYDVQPFLYYVMTLRDSRGCHVLGYFSKEKESAEGYNVACILTLPQHQRFGYGRLLIEFSYELSKKEGKLGSPEKPLSDLGLLGYKAYWGEAIVRYLLELGPGEDVTVEGIATATSITPGDIMYTCQAMHLIKSSRSQHLICLTDAVKEQYERTKVKRKRRINPDGLKDWKPPFFSRDQLRFGW
ncbi:Histone acetyltransferase [Tulasnella sp. 427]|nr:Histone acetyltransferase [Tulasnella sp. 427]